MKPVFAITILSILFFSCKNSGKENKPVTVEDFFKLYKEANLPVSITDSALENFGDTTTISAETFVQFVPDSALQKIPVSEYHIHPAGIIHFKTEDYLLTKFTSGKTNKLAVFVFDEKHHYKTGLMLLNTSLNDGYTYSVSITNEPTFIIKKEKIDADKKDLYSRNGYAYNESTNMFTVVMNDSNEKKSTDIINPIDTLGVLNKFSGDYITDKKNFISVRDGKNARSYIFFIHFEKNNGKCIGELKGKMNLVDETNAVYQENGDPCVIRFKFSSTSIKIKEDGNCGNYRGITCPFDFTFKKKKVNKAKTK